jgi:hypothetical protein
MKALVIAMATMLALAGCGEVKHEEAKIQARDDAMNAATKRMVVVTGTDVPGHPSYTSLGAVQGYCEKKPNGDDQVIAGDSMKQSAYRKYGAQVDAIIQTNAWFVPEGGATSGVYEPYTSYGHFECAGTAVTFGGTAQSQP